MADHASPQAAFGHALRTHRRRAGLTQDELAALTGAGQSTLSAYECGDSEPSLSLAVRIAHALGIDITDLAEPFLPAPHLRKVAS